MTLLVLFDRDGTLIRDIPYNGDPSLVQPMPTAHDAVNHLRERDVAIGVITNQSAIGLGFITHDDADAVHARIDEMFGPMDTWQVCPHAPHDGCTCRKPHGLMVERAAEELGVDVTQTCVVGDIGTDVEAALSVGASAILVPNETTLEEDVAAAPVVAATLLEAAHVITGRR